MLKLLSRLWQRRDAVALRRGRAAFGGKAGEHVEHERLCRDILDPAYYLATYKDIAQAGVDPLVHYTVIGHKEGRLPFSLQSGDAEKRTSRALRDKPNDPLFLEVNFYLRLRGGDVREIESTLDAYRGRVGDGECNARYTRIAEDAAGIICGRYLRLESVECTDTVLRVLEAFRALFPESQTIRSLVGVVRFSASDLHRAEGVLSTVQLESLSPQVAKLCTEITAQLAEARTVNRAPLKNGDLLLLDSSFPSRVSSFRYGEFNEYLMYFQNSTIQVRLDYVLFRYGESLSFSQLAERYCAETGVSPDRLRRFDRNDIGTPKLAYCVFLSEADYFFSDIGLPPTTDLIFTLYPGGGFALHDKISDMKLRRLFDNRRLRKVITTQVATYDYLIDGRFCSPHQIEHIYGGIVPSVYAEAPKGCVSRCPDGPLNVCFVAQRYTPTGAEKGYETFISVFKQFASSPRVNFHVVGGFDAKVIPIPNSSNIRFYGTRGADFFDAFYREMDLIISPNVNMATIDPTWPGTFDGFPTTAVVEAGLRGVAIFLTDPMGMNRRLDGSRIFNDSEMTIIDRDADRISSLIRDYLGDRQALIDLGLAGRKAILKEFSHDAQIRPRIGLIKKTLAGNS